MDFDFTSVVTARSFRIRYDFIVFVSIPGPVDLDAIGDGVGERVFGVAAPRDKKGAECDGEGFVQLRCGPMDFGKIFRAKDGDGDGVVEDERLRIVKLMRGAAHGYAECGA